MLELGLLLRPPWVGPVGWSPQLASDARLADPRISPNQLGEGATRGRRLSLGTLDCRVLYVSIVPSFGYGEELPCSKKEGSKVFLF